MNDKQKTVLISGATGRQGGAVIRHMLPKGWKLRALTRNPSSYAASKDSRVSPVDVRDIAAVTVAVLTGTEHEGKTYVLTGPESLSYADVAEKFSKALRRKVTYVDVSREAAKKALLDAGAPEWFAEGRWSSSDFAGKASNSVLHRRSRTWRGRIPRPSMNSRRNTRLIFAERQVPDGRLRCRQSEV
jgi:uncharacterized protein YbjT (DUF2867 family)